MAAIPCYGSFAGEKVCRSTCDISDNPKHYTGLDNIFSSIHGRTLRVAVAQVELTVANIIPFYQLNYSLVKDERLHFLYGDIASRPESDPTIFTAHAPTYSEAFDNINELCKEQTNEDPRHFVYCCHPVSLGMTPSSSCDAFTNIH